MRPLTYYPWPFPFIFLLIFDFNRNGIINQIEKVKVDLPSEVISYPLVMSFFCQNGRYWLSVDFTRKFWTFAKNLWSVDRSRKYDRLKCLVLEAGTRVGMCGGGYQQDFYRCRAFTVALPRKLFPHFFCSIRRSVSLCLQQVWCETVEVRPLPTDVSRLPFVQGNTVSSLESSLACYRSEEYIIEHNSSC